MTTLGPEYELKQVINAVKSAKSGILSIVIDSYDYKNFLVNACFNGYELNNQIINFLINLMEIKLFSVQIVVILYLQLLIVWKLLKMALEVMKMIRGTNYSMEMLDLGVMV